MRTGLVAVWIDHQFVDHLWLEQHVASAAGFILDDADGLWHVADDALVVETTDHVRKIHHQFQVIPAELLDFQFILFTVADQFIRLVVKLAVQTIDDLLQILQQ